MGQVVVEEQGGGVLLATLSNPPHGLMDAAMVEGLEALARRADEDPGVTGVVLTGDHPERFIAHYDVREILGLALEAPVVGRRVALAAHRTAGGIRRVPGGAAMLDHTPLAGVSAAERFGEALLRFSTAGAVVVAAINGHAMGGGCELAVACDLRIMARGDFGIGQPEILLGFPPGGGGTQRLARMLGTAQALRLCLDGGPISQEVALEIGLIDEIVPADTLVEHALQVATGLAARPKAGIAGVKRAIHLGSSQSLPAGLRSERAEFSAAVATEDAKKAMQAYVDQLDATGVLPAYDEATMARVAEQGRFS